jgi:hypothetical protein
VAVVINSCRLDPLPQNIKGFSFLLGTEDFEIGSFPYLSVNPREGIKALEEIFNFNNSLPFSLYQSPWHSIPPAIMDTQFGAVSVFIVPINYLDSRMKIKLMFKDKTRAQDNGIPDEIYGQTGTLDK